MFDLIHYLLANQSILACSHSHHQKYQETLLQTGILLHLHEIIIGTSPLETKVSSIFLIFNSFPKDRALRLLGLLSNDLAESEYSTDDYDLLITNVIV